MFIFRLINRNPNNSFYYIHYGAVFNGFTDISRIQKLITYLNKKDDILEMNASGIFYVDVEDSLDIIYTYQIVKEEYDLDNPIKEDIFNDQDQYSAMTGIMSDNFVKLVSNLAFTDIQNYTYEVKIPINDTVTYTYNIDQIDFLCSTGVPYLPPSLPDSNIKRILFGKLYNMYNITDLGQYVVNRSKAYGLFCLPPYTVRFDFFSAGMSGNQLNIGSDYTITLSGGNHYTHLLVVVSGTNVSIIQSTTINTIDTKNKIGIEDNITPVSHGHLNNVYNNNVSVKESIPITENINNFFGL